MKQHTHLSTACSRKKLYLNGCDKKKESSWKLCNFISFVIKWFSQMLFLPFLWADGFIRTSLFFFLLWMDRDFVWKKKFDVQWANRKLLWTIYCIICWQKSNRFIRLKKVWQDVYWLYIEYIENLNQNFIFYNFTSEG